jgi:uncharacterized membrane protein YjfL (UPF0719 family)
MSPDEGLLLVLSVVAGPVALTIWFFRLARVSRLGRGPSYVAGLRSATIASAAVLVLVLRTLSAPDVRDDFTYLALYFLLGLAWLRLSEFLFGLVGTSGRDDVIERRNGAALPVTSGAMLGAVLCYAGGNIGAGPGWWVVVFSAALATCGLFAVWIGMDLATNVAERVRIDRDAAAGGRMGALLVAVGAVLGRAVAGDWQSLSATLVDFVVVGWPAVGLLALAIAAERGTPPAYGAPGGEGRFSPGAVGSLYLVLAFAYIAWLGWPV